MDDLESLLEEDTDLGAGLEARDAGLVVGLPAALADQLALLCLEQDSLVGWRTQRRHARLHVEDDS